MSRILGLDLGTNSIGWAIVEKIGTDASSFGFELSELEHAAFDRKLYEFLGQNISVYVRVGVLLFHGSFPCLN